MGNFRCLAPAEEGVNFAPIRRCNVSGDMPVDVPSNAGNWSLLLRRVPIPSVSPIQCDRMPQRYRRAKTVSTTRAFELVTNTDHREQ